MKWDLHREKPIESLYKQKKMKWNWGKLKQLWRVDNRRKVLFRDELRICIGYGDDVGTIVWYRLNET